VSLTELLAEEFKEIGVSINCLCLGAVQTEMLEAAFPGYQAPHSASQIADFIHKFTTQNGPFMNGKIIPVSISNP
jgi:3-oxoacyl-[acyl-carrier protein] reductase